MGESYQHFDQSSSLDTLLKKIGDLKALLNADENGDGRLNYSEFVTYCNDNGITRTDQIQKLFHTLDVNDDGYISTQDDITGDHIIDVDDTNARKRTVHERTPFGTKIDEDSTHALLAEYELGLGEQRAEQIKSSHQIEREGETTLHIFEVQIKNLPEELVGTEILQLSDIHFKTGSTASERKLGNLKRLLEKRGIVPKAIVCTGDYLDKKKEDFTDASVESLRSLDFGCPRYFVLGNHDFGDGEIEIEGTAPIIRKRMEDSGYMDVTDKVVPLEIKGHRINFVGIDDPLFGEVRTPKLTEQKQDVNIILTHSLDAIHNGFPGCLDLILSGHLHSGEIRLGKFDGVDYMIGRYYDNINSQKRGWKALSDRTLSYIDPGFSTTIPIKRRGTEEEGATLFRLVKEK